MLTPHCSAASGMVAPSPIASTTRLRKSSEYGFAIHAGLIPVGSLNHIRAVMGIPDSAFSGNALSVRATLNSAKRGWTEGEAAVYVNLLNELAPIFRSEDFQERVRALKEGRPPVYHGR